MTSLTGNHVTGTTTLTTSNLSSNNPQSASVTFLPTANSSISGSVASDTSQSRTIQSIAHVHQPPASLYNKQAQQQQTKVVVNQQPLAGGWLIGESAKGTLITNDQQAYQNILNNNTNSNNISVNSAGGTVVYSSNCISSTSETATNTALNASSSSLSGAASALAASGDSIKYGNTSKTATSSELLANGHGPRREVNFYYFFFSRPIKPVGITSLFVFLLLFFGAPQQLQLFRIVRQSSVMKCSRTQCQNT